MKVEFISQQDADNIKRQMPTSKTMQEYLEYWRKLPKNQVGKIVVSSTDGIKPQTIKSRLARAGKNLKVDAQIKRVGNVILFWKEGN